MARGRELGAGAFGKTDITQGRDGELTDIYPRVDTSIGPYVANIFFRTRTADPGPFWVSSSKNGLPSASGPDLCPVGSAYPLVGNIADSVSAVF